MLTKIQKKKVINDLADKIKRQQGLIFTDMKGIKVVDIQKLRREIKKAEGEYKVAKKTLTNLALKQEKRNIDMTKFEGSLSLVFGYKEPVSLAKILVNFGKKNENLKILGGLINNVFFTTEQIKDLANIPSREELLAKLIWSIQYPISGFANVLQSNIRNLISILSALQSK
jgi:large subunit ribosomal protein L10